MPKRWYGVAFQFQLLFENATFILPDHNTFGLMDLRDLVDNMDNEGDE
jgi:hypothetical protein